MSKILIVLSLLILALQFMGCQTERNSMVLPVPTATEISKKPVKMTEFPGVNETSGFTDINDACMLAAEGKYQEAVDAFNILLPKYSDGSVTEAYVLAQRGGAYGHLDDKENTEKDFRDALKLVSSQKQRAVLLFQIAREYSNYPDKNGSMMREQEMFDILKEIKQIEPDFNIDSRIGSKARVMSYNMLGNIMLRRRNYSEAIKCFNEVLKIMPNDIETYADKAKANFLAGDEKSAVADAKQYLNLYSRVDNNQLSQKEKEDSLSVYVFIVLKDLDKALDISNIMVSREQDNPYSYLNRAWVYYKMGNKQKAKADLDTAMELSGSEKYLVLSINDLKKKIAELRD